MERYNDVKSSTFVSRSFSLFFLYYRAAKIKEVAVRKEMIEKMFVHVKEKREIIKSGSSVSNLHFQLHGKMCQCDTTLY